MTLAACGGDPFRGNAEPEGGAALGKGGRSGSGGSADSGNVGAGETNAGDANAGGTQAGQGGAYGYGGSHAGSAGDAGAPEDGGVTPVLSAPSRGAPLALSGDEKIAVAVNRDVGTVSVLSVKYEDGQVTTTSSIAEQPFIALSPAGIQAELAGKGPIGVAIGSANRKFALVENDITRNLTTVDFNTQAVAGGVTAPSVTQLAALPVKGSDEDHILLGKDLFNTGRARWSLNGEGWGACQSCHSDGLTDNVTWFFGRGPRQSVSLDTSFSSKNPADQRLFNHTTNRDEVADFERPARRTCTPATPARWRPPSPTPSPSTTRRSPRTSSSRATRASPSARSTSSSSTYSRSTRTRPPSRCSLPARKVAHSARRRSRRRER